MSGSLICETESDCVPPVGSTVTIKTNGYKKGIWGGSIIQFPVSAEHPPIYDFADGSLVVSIDVNNWEVLKAAPAPEGEEE